MSHYCKLIYTFAILTTTPIRFVIFNTSADWCTTNCYHTQTILVSISLFGYLLSLYYQPCTYVCTVAAKNSSCWIWVGLNMAVLTKYVAVFKKGVCPQSLSKKLLNFYPIQFFINFECCVYVCNECSKLQSCTLLRVTYCVAALIGYLNLALVSWLISIL